MITDMTAGVTVDEFLGHAIDGEGDAGVRLALDAGLRALAPFVGDIELELHS